MNWQKCQKWCYKFFLLLFQLLEERDTLQLKLSNVMRQFERHKESASRASTACSTPIPWIDSATEVKELRHKWVLDLFKICNIFFWPQAIPAMFKQWLFSATFLGILTISKRFQYEPIWNQYEINAINVKSIWNHFWNQISMKSKRAISCEVIVWKGFSGLLLQ